jgi:hypothetical protein
VRRPAQPHPDGQRRWDRAYHLLVEWAPPPALTATTTTEAPATLREQRHSGQPSERWEGHMRVAIYGRVSTQRQAQAQSIEQQLDRLRAHVAAHAGQGWELREEHVFRDDG